MKKTFKRLGAALLAMAMAVSVLCTGALADGSYSITIENTTDGYTYEAYQVFAGTLDIGITDWGSNLKGQEKALIDALKADETIGSDFTNVLNKGNTTVSETSADAAQNVAAAIKDYENDSAKAKAFAKIVAEKVTGTAAGTANTVTDTKGYVISLENAGYYVVKNTVAPSGDTDKDAAYSNYILKVVGTETIKPKSSHPSVTKKVQNETANETTGKDATTANFGDTVKFTLTATLPDHYADYEKYALTFHDTMSSSLSYTENSVEVTYQKYKEENGEWVKDTAEGSTGTIPATNNYEVKTSPDDNHTIDVVFSNVKNLKTADGKDIKLGAHDQIIVTYRATVQNSAGLGVNGNNTNTVYLEYSNNPNNTTDKGKTPEEVVKVYTFQLDVKKVAENENGTALSGAQFVLAKEKITNFDSTKITTEEYTSKFVGVSGSAPTYTVGGTDYVMDVSNADNTKGELNIKGLKDGVYYLYETKAPDGYNKLTEPIEITITASKDKDVPNGKVSATLTNAAAGTIEEVTTGILDKVTVVNNAGSQLPSTGGMGTTLFYIIGGVLMAGAAVVLVIKKKRSSAE